MFRVVKRILCAMQTVYEHACVDFDFKDCAKTSKIITLSDFHPFNSKYSDLFMCSTLGLPIQLTFSYNHIEHSTF